MRRPTLPGKAMAVCCVVASGLAAPAAATAAWDTDPAVEQRANAIVAGMTTEEKVDLATGQLNNFYGFFNNGEERVGIPAQTMADGPVGVRIANPNADRRTTRFPSGTAMGATFDRALLRLVGETLGNEAFHTGHNVLLAPSVDIARTPLWGRTFEGFGEDPLLSGEIGAAYIAGVQTNPVMATIKHFAVNDQETSRFTISSQVDDRTLHEIYTKPYEIGVREASPGAAMCSFNRLNEVAACENPLMNTLLKGEYGHRGFTMSDYNATPSTVRAANSGLDQEQPGDQGPGSANFGERLLAAVDAGDVSMTRLDDMARRQLRPMIGLGLFDNPVQADRFDEQAHGQVARRVAQEGTVLLKNERRTLPFRLGARLRSIAVIGPDADNASAQGGGSATIANATYEVSPLEGIRRRAGSGTRVTYAAGTDGISEGDLLPGPAPVPSTILRPDGGQPGDRGLHAQFWPNTSFAGAPGLDLVDPNVNVNWGFQNFSGFNAASPKATSSQAVTGNTSLLGDLSARWTGELIPPATADYRLGLTSRGTARLFIDGALVLENTSDAVTTQSVPVSLRAGEPRSVRIEYSAPAFSMFQGGQVRFFWDHDDSVMAPAMRDAVADARAADAAVVVVRDYETEGGSRQADRPHLNLPKEQDQLIRRVARANPNTVVVITTGGVTKTSNWEEDVRAILQAWYPGQEQGNAIADIVFGDVNPSGKLPATIPNDESQVPPIDLDQVAEHPEGVFVGYRGFQQRGDTPSYPFGHGLSYSTFGYRLLRVADGAPGTPQGDVRVSFRLRNRSRRAGAEVAQVYIGRLPTRSVSTPPRQLAGFQKVQLAGHEARRVTVTIPRRSLSYWDSGAQHWVTPSGNLPVYVGGSSEDTALAGVINVR
ncbi:MAG: beta-glucosidase [Thermoleophilaceae bacterium]|jgi:beta-glucosidase|nr:beta-glucosidase [Thermoleophilaceae bacterium]